MIPVIIVQMFIPIAELVMAGGTQTNEANAEIQTQTTIV